MLDKALRAFAAAAAMAAAAAIGVIAAAFAVYAAITPWLGPAWAAAIVTAVMALIVLGLALAFRPHRARATEEEAPDASLVDKVVALARAHPLIAVGAAVGVGVYAIRNPKLVTAVLTAFLAGRGTED